MRLRTVFRGVDPLVAGVVAALLVVVALYAWAVALAEDYYLVQAPNGSVFSSANGGLQVLYRYLDTLGVAVDTLERFDELPESGTIVIAADGPFAKTLTDSESKRLMEWIDSGGRVVLVGHAAGEAVAHGRIGAGRQVSGEGTSTLHPMQPVACFQGVDEVVIGSARLLADGAEWVALLKDSGGQGLVSRAYGTGEIVWLSDMHPLSNAGIADADNARFATLLAAVGGDVWFDEYHHGFASGGGVWERLGHGGRAAVSLVMLAVALLVYFGARRLAPAIAAAEQRRARTGAYISSLAELFRGAHAHADALRTLSEGLEQALARRWGSVEAGRARHIGAADALDHAEELADQGRLKRDVFIKASRAIARARREVEGRDG